MSEESAVYYSEYKSRKAAEKAIKMSGERMPKSRGSKYSPPGPYRVRALFSYMGWEKNEAADMFDVNVSTVRRWCTRPEKPEYRPIPYATWLLALTMAELTDLDKIRAA